MKKRRDEKNTRKHKHILEVNKRCTRTHAYDFFLFCFFFVLDGSCRYVFLFSLNFILTIAFLLLFTWRCYCCCCCFKLLWNRWREKKVFGNLKLFFMFTENISFRQFLFVFFFFIRWKKKLLFSVYFIHRLNVYLFRRWVHVRSSLKFCVPTQLVYSWVSVKAERRGECNVSLKACHLFYYYE